MKIVKTILSFAVLFFAVAAEGATVALTEDTGDVTLENGDVLTGTGGTNTHIVVASSATVTLRDVDITAIAGGNNWSGITCNGNATIILQGLNNVCGGHEDYPGVYVPVGSTLTIQGDGALNAGSNGFGAGIGGGYYISCGNIVIAGGTITATGGFAAAGIGGGIETECGSIEVGTKNNSFVTVTATGGESAPGIGAGASGLCGGIVIDEMARCVTANAGVGDWTPISVGAGQYGIVGTIGEDGEVTYGTLKVAGVAQTYTIDDSTIPGIAASTYIYNPCITNITSAADWNAFASRVNRGIDAYDGLTVTLAADISVTNMVGIVSRPFGGTFEGGGHSLVVDISTGGAAGATFGNIRGATIRNLNVSGSVTGGRHSAGLVATCVNTSTNTISGCNVSVVVSNAEYAGGIVGHGGNVNENLSIKDCVFSGTIFGFANHAGGILGWGDTMTLSISNCLFKGSFAPASSGTYHPVACMNNYAMVSSTVIDVYYLKDLAPTAGGKIVISDAGTPVSSTYIPFEWVYEVTAADGLAYYTAAHVITLTSETGAVLLRDGYVLKGAGGASTSVTIESGASVLLRGVTIPGDNSVVKVGITCAGDAVLNFDDVNAVNGGGARPGIQVPDGSTLVVKGGGRLDVVGGGAAGAIVGAVDIDDGLINISGGNGYTLVPGIKIAEDESNAAAIAQHDGRSEYVWLNGRTLLKDGSLNTLCLPFSMSAAEIAASPLAGALIKAFDSESVRVTSDGLMMGFTNVTEIVAGRPYVVRWTPVLVIRSTEDWNAFAEDVTSGANLYKGDVVKLEADINVSTMIGTAQNPFCGTLDGNGHTITVHLAGGGEGIALFYYINGATIQNLSVKGTIASSKYRPATFASFVSGNSTIQNCRSDVAITASYNGWIDGGAIVARVSSGCRLNVVDCAFYGSIKYSNNGYEGGGMIGWTQDNTSVSFTNCLFMPSKVEIARQNEDSYVFASGVVRGGLLNCYYNEVAASSPLNKEGTYIFSGIYPSLLAQFLGDNWEVSDSTATPMMNAAYAFETTIERPMFNAVTVSAATAKVEGEILDFVGSTSPVTLDGNRSVLVINADGTLAFANAGDTIGSCRAYFQLHGPGALQDVTHYSLTYGETSASGELVPPSTGGYGLWAAHNGVAGAWNETDASGVCNVFRYAFDKPSGAFADPPLLAITIENGNAVIHTPPLVNSDGFTFSIVATDALGEGAATVYPLDPSGRTVIPAANKPARFFRLRAAENL